MCQSSLRPPRWFSVLQGVSVVLAWGGDVDAEGAHGVPDVSKGVRNQQGLDREGGSSWPVSSRRAMQVSALGG